MFKELRRLLSPERTRHAGRIAIIYILSVGTLSGLTIRNATAQSYSIYAAEATTTLANTVDMYQYDFNASNQYVGSSIAYNTGLSYVNGLAFVPRGTDAPGAQGNRMLYRSGFGASTGESGAGNFYTWNRDTRIQSVITWSGSGTNLNPIGGNGNTSSIAFANGDWYNGAYYAIAANTNDLYKVTFNTAFTQYTANILVTNVNNGGANDTFSFGDIAIVKSGTNAGLLYGFGTANGDTPQFFRGFIPATAQTTLTSPARSTFTAASGVNSAANNPNVQLALGTNQTTLFGVTLAGDWVNMNNINGTPTAQVPIGSRTDNTNIPTVANLGFTDTTSGAAFQPVPAPPAAVSLAIGGLVGLIGTGAKKLRARRRKQAAKKA